MVRLRLVATAVLLLAAGCGSSREEQEFDRIAEECRGFVGASATVRTADRAFPQAIRTAPVCIAQLAPMGRNDTCPGSTSANPQCQVFYYWYPSDPGLCEPGGCWLVCEVRVMRQDPAWGEAGSSLDATICASRFVRGQPSP